MANPVKVIGVGPGSPDYLLPVARQAVRACQVVVGAPRVLQLFNLVGKKVHAFTGDWESLLSLLRHRVSGETVGILVSGDPGFYSLLSFLRRHLGPEEIEVIPGISSVQVAFARLKLPWQEAHLLSLHGKKVADFSCYVNSGRPVGLLVDPRTSGRDLQRMLEPYGSFKVHLCRNLTYPDEEIITVTLTELARVQDLGNAVVVIEPDDA